jgi:hypothetical protein
MAILAFILPLAILALLDLAALRWGVDSRDGSTDPRRPTGPLDPSAR